MTHATPRTPRVHTTGRRLIAGASALAMGLTLGVVLAASPAQAATTVDDGSLNWGFRQNFRSYVGNQTGAFPPVGPLPAGERITTIAPATFDPAASPVDEKRAYVFPAVDGTVTSSTAATVKTSGGVGYHFPSHFFDITIANPTVVVTGTTAKILADTSVIVTDAASGKTPGTYGGTQIELGSAATVATSITSGGSSATISGSDVTLTAAGASALQDFLAEGSALDSFTAAVELEDPVVAVPTVTVDKTVVNPSGDTVTVTGTGFDPAAAIGTRPPYSGVPAGVYVAFGKFASNWKPSAGAASSARVTLPQADGGVKWAVPVTPTPAGAQYVPLAADGSFTATVNVKRNFTGAPATGNYGIYTYPGSGAAAPSYETATPVSFTTAQADLGGVAGLVEPGDSVTVSGTGFDANESVQVVLHSTPVTIATLAANAAGAVSGTVIIPTDTEDGTHEIRLVGALSGIDALAGAFTVGDPDLGATQTITTEVVATGALAISVADDTVTLPSPVLNGDGELWTNGAINAVKVVDLRWNDPGWTVSGQVTDFTSNSGSIDGSWLGWTPSIIAAGTNVGEVIPGSSVAPGAGIKTARTLATSAAGSGRGTAYLGADLLLSVPTTTVPDTYSATLTLTALG